MSPVSQVENASQLAIWPEGLSAGQEAANLDALSDDQLKALANGRHKQFIGCLRRGIAEHARLSGAALIELKKRVAGRKWTEWLRNNFDGSVATARVYMRIARHWAEIVEQGWDQEATTLEGLRSLLADPEPEYKKPALDIDGTEPPIVLDQPRAPSIRKVELLVDADDDHFAELVEDLKYVFGTDNVTDTVYASLEDSWRKEYCCG